MAAQLVSVMYYEEPELLPTESLTPAPPCISYYKQNKVYRLVHDDSRQLEWSRSLSDCKSLLLTELQKRADLADQSVLFFLAGANFWEKHEKNCAILCIFVYFLCIFWC